MEPAQAPRLKGSAGGQFSPEDRPDDPPLAEDELLMQVTDHAAASGDSSAVDPEDKAAGDDEFKLLQEHFRGRG